MKADSDGVYLGFSFSESASHGEFSMKSSTWDILLGAFWYGCDRENQGRYSIWWLPQGFIHFGWLAGFCPLKNTWNIQQKRLDNGRYLA